MGSPWTKGISMSQENDNYSDFIGLDDDLISEYPIFRVEAAPEEPVEESKNSQKIDENRMSEIVQQLN